jgi:hypothetical protein
MPFHSFRFPGSFADTDEIRNAAFSMATMVMVPYCSADEFSGQILQPSDDTFGFHFGGHWIVNAVFTELLTNPKRLNVSALELVVLTGGSAGAVGSVLHLDHLADLLKNVGSNARVVGAPIGGFNNVKMLSYPGEGALPHYRYDEEHVAKYCSIWRCFLPKRCVERSKAKNLSQDGHEDTRCMFGLYNTASMESDVMFFTPQTDMVYLHIHFGLPSFDMSPPFDGADAVYLNAFADEQREEMRSVYRPGVGIFNPACWTHVYMEGIVMPNRYNDTDGSTHVTWMRYQDAFQKFLKTRKVFLQDFCGLACSRGCSSKKEVNDFIAIGAYLG